MQVYCSRSECGNKIRKKKNKEQRHKTESTTEGSTHTPRIAHTCQYAYAYVHTLHAPEHIYICTPDCLVLSRKVIPGALAYKLMITHTLSHAQASLTHASNTPVCLFHSMMGFCTLSRMPAISTFAPNADGVCPNTRCMIPLIFLLCV
jgi:hypothetical protein